MSGVEFKRIVDTEYYKLFLRGVFKEFYYRNVNLIESDLVCYEFLMFFGWIFLFDLLGYGNVNLYVIFFLKGVRKYWIGNVF